LRSWDHFWLIGVFFQRLLLLFSNKFAVRLARREALGFGAGSTRFDPSQASTPFGECVRR
jgi:hypothetical protein